MAVSVSRIKLFKACRRAYWLRYVQGLEPIAKSEALEVGKNYHELIEWLYKYGSLGGVEEDNSKELAMASAYWKYIYPQVKVKQTEVWLEKGKFHGRLDGIAEDGAVVEHKTTGGSVGEDYEYDLLWDEQILLYMWMLGTNEAYYTVCRKPTIRQKKNESDEEFYRRMVEWYDTDTDQKIRLIKLYRTDEEIKQCVEELVMVANEMKKTSDRVCYRNTGNCYRWGRRCEYASICLSYDENQQYVEFERRT